MAGFHLRTYELLSIPGHTSQAILAHHVNRGHGTGMVQDNMLLLGMYDEHFKILLDTQEYKSEDIMGEGRTVEQKSTLQPFPDGTIEETRATMIHEDTPEHARLTSIERRRWRWRSTSRSFTAGKFITVKP